MKYIKNIYKYTLLVVMAIIVSGCENFLDVNNDPTRVAEEDLNLQALLPTIIEATSASHYSAVFSASRATHHVDHVSGYYSEFTMESNWIRIYLSSLNTAQVMYDMGGEQSSPYYQGIARILQAVNIGLLTDTWEDAPLTDALQGVVETLPEYDTQEEMYAQLFTYLDEAIILLGATESFENPAGDDLVYGGDITKWTKLAHSLKARYMLHLSNKAAVNWAGILAEIDLGFGSNGDDFQLFYNSVNLNPLHNGVALSNETGNLTITHGKYFVDLMNGTTYPLFDPRLPIIADTVGNDGSTNTYEGLASYDDTTPTHTCEISKTTWYATISAPVLMMTYAELKFIESEAALNSGAVARSNTAYLAGIGAHMDMLGVATADKDAYMADPSVALGGTPDLEHIMKEKYVALFLNFESWNDMRRHGFNSAVFKDFVEPDWNGRSQPGQRALHPTSEKNRNVTNLTPFIKDFVDGMWKDN